MVRELDIPLDLEAIASDNLSRVVEMIRDFCPPESFTEAEASPESIEIAQLSVRIANSIAPYNLNARSAVNRGLSFGETLYSLLILPANGTILDTGAYLALGQRQRQEAWHSATEDFLANNPVLGKLIDDEAFLITPKRDADTIQLTKQASAFALMTAKEYGVEY
jgi:hypothetical protein